MATQPPTPAAIAYLIENGMEDEAKKLCKEHKIAFPQDPSKPSTSTDKPVGQIGTEQWLGRFITRNKAMLELKDMVRKLAAPNIQDPVLIQGETGTGKELIARALHGDRKGMFVPLNCAGMPEHLIESELFGHVAGAFTDGKQTKRGLMSQADGGTLFLDEIGDLNYSLQAKFLRAIQDRRVRKVGSNVEEDITCRIVCASHYNLPTLVRENKFRLDLYARIGTFELRTTPLSERPDDIPLILSSLDSSGNSLKMFNELYQTATTVEDTVKPTGYDYTKLELPLNVRSLQQIVKRYLVLGIKP